MISILDDHPQLSSGKHPGSQVMFQTPWGDPPPMCLTWLSFLECGWGEETETMGRGGSFPPTKPATQKGELGEGWKSYLVSSYWCQYEFRLWSSWGKGQMVMLRVEQNLRGGHSHHHQCQPEQCLTMRGQRLPLCNHSPQHPLPPSTGARVGSPLAPTGPHLGLIPN